MDASLAVGLAAVATVLGIVLLLAFSFVGAFLPELLMVLVGIVAVVAVVAIALMVLAYKSRD
jgi:hypothetical protein